MPEEHENALPILPLDTVDKLLHLGIAVLTSPQSQVAPIRRAGELPLYFLILVVVFVGETEGDILRPQAVVDLLVERGVACNGTALDLGCGAGRNACFLAEQGFRVFATDFVSEALRNTVQRAEQ